MNDTLEVFVGRLLDERGVGDIGEEVLAQMKADLLERVEDRINMCIVEHLPPEALAEFEQLLDSDATDEQVQEFCGKKIANIDEVIASELLQFRQTYLSN